MNYNTETTQVQFINQAFIDKLNRGHTKEAELAMTTFVRQKLREMGFTRKILGFNPITPAELDRQVTEEPTVIVEKEPDSVAASMGFTGRPNVRYFKAPRYPVTFEKLSSEDFRKSKFELATYRTDIRTVIQENSIRDLQTQEDVGFYQNILSIANTTGNVYNLTGGMTSENMLAGVSYLVQKQLPVGKVLMTQSAYLKLIGQPATNIGSIAASELFKGQTGISTPYGFEIVTTIKNDVLPDNQFIVFTQPDYLGQMYAMQDATVFLKVEQDMIQFNVYESVGVGIGNVNGAIVCNF